MTINTAYANFLNTQKWDYFTTLTYKWDVKQKQNRRNMDRMISALQKSDPNFNIFWVTEYTNYNYNTHNHLLVKGDIVGDINYHLKSKSLIGNHIKHLPYEKGASMYVSKFICDEKTEYGFVKK